MLMMPTGSAGTGWVATGPGVLRNARSGDVNGRGVYYRFQSEQDYAPPYVWSGSVRTISLMSPPVFEDGTPAWYRPGLVFHPMYGSSSTPAAGNEENVLIGLGTYDRPEGHVGISAELRAERPAEPYGSRSGYARKHARQPAPFPFWDGLWHNFEIVVHSHAHYTLMWDGVMLADVLENSPATMSGRNRVGLRCDFTDIEIRDWAVQEIVAEATEPMVYRIVPRTEVGLPAVVRDSTGALRPPLYNEPMMTAHYTGNNIDYTGKDTAEITRQIQRVFSSSKPFEYNYVIGQNDDDEIVEFAGKFQAAHSGGENNISFGVLFLLGVGEQVTDRMIDKWRWLRDVLIYTGALRADVDQRPHKLMPGARTACAGVSVDARWPEFLPPWQTSISGSGDNKMITLNKPIRMLDTRDQRADPLPSGTWPQTLPAGIPARAEAVFVTVTATDASSGGFITLWGSGARPNTSNLNYPAGAGAICNTTLTRVVGGKFQMFNVSPCHVILDVVGYA